MAQTDAAATSRMVLATSTSLGAFETTARPRTHASEAEGCGAGPHGGGASMRSLGGLRGQRKPRAGPTLKHRAGVARANCLRDTSLAYIGCRPNEAQV